MSIPFSQSAQSVLPCDMEGADAVPALACLPAGSTRNGFFYFQLPAAVSVISDIHLSREQPENFRAWQRFMRQTSTDILLLGDVFDVWVGDDILDASAVSDSLAAADSEGMRQRLQQRHHFAQQCVQVLRDCIRAGRRVYIMRGNRDFLLGEHFFAETGSCFLPDPCVLQWESATAASGCLLSHGDMLCTGDTDYLAFRQQVRSAEWQRNFLNKPLLERVQIAERLREQSEDHQSHQSARGGYVDVDDGAARLWLERSQQSVLIHGHTHTPGCHWLAEPAVGQAQKQRYVLSDWQLTASPARGDTLLLHADGSIQRISTVHADLGY